MAREHRRREKKSAFVPFASFRYLRNNAKTPVSIKKKDITAATTSSRSLLRKSGSINWSLRMDPTFPFPILSQLARKHDPVIPSIRGPQRWRIQGEILDCLDNGPQADWIMVRFSRPRTCRQQTPCSEPRTEVLAHDPLCCIECSIN